MVQLSQTRNEEKCEDKIRPPDSYKSKVNTVERAALKWSKGSPKMEPGPALNGVRAALKWSKGRPEMESGGLIYP